MLHEREAARKRIQEQADAAESDIAERWDSFRATKARREAELDEELEGRRAAVLADLEAEEKELCEVVAHLQSGMLDEWIPRWLLVSLRCGRN